MRVGSAAASQTKRMGYKKVCVEVLARFSGEGGMRPIELIWRDGRKYAVERVRFAERAPAHVPSPLPLRFTCVIGGKERFLYFEPERMRWFVEVPCDERALYPAQRSE